MNNLLKIDVLNIILMLISTVAALLLPFELFLFSYAVLGPLHYTTEISWLHQRRYFAVDEKSGKKDLWMLIFICSIISLLVLLISLWPVFKTSPIVENFLLQRNINKVSFESEILMWPASLIFLAFTASFVITFVKDWWFRTNAFVIVFVLAFIFKGTFFYGIIFGVFLTTLIHVWLFTAIFMLNGATRNRAISSYLSLIIFLLCSASFFFISKENYVIGKYAAEVFSSESFSLNKIIFQIFDVSSEAQNIFYSDFGRKLQGFIAFAYTYHYLNWFSKVNVIKWNEVPKKWLIFSIAIWIAALGLYGYDYRLGFYALLFLSMMHVFLEFPLNFRSIVMIVKKRDV